MARLGLAYVHMIEGETGGAREPEGVSFDYAALRRSFSGAWIVNNGYTQALAEDAVASGRVDLVAFGKAFISNPEEEARLNDEAYQDRMADAIVRGIRRYFARNPPMAKSKLARLD